jgi:peptide/nickel transport system substrate-binding protein
MRPYARAMALVLGAILVTSLGWAGTPRPGGTLVVAIGADATGLDPRTVMNNESGFVMSAVLDGLTQYKRGTTEVEPGLAESWTVSADGKTITFRLRKGVKFHDGTAFDADAVVFDFDRILNDKSPYFYRAGVTAGSFVPEFYGEVTGYQKVDQYTVRVTLKRKFAPFLDGLATSFSGLVSPAAVKQWGAVEVAKHPIGTGPFKLVEWVRNDHITVEANPDYWGGKPNLDRIVYRIIPENSVRLLNLEQGSVDIVDGVNPDDIQRIKANSKLVLLEQAGATINGISMNNQKAPFNDPRVRQAMNYAVNREEINNFLYKGVAVLSTNPVPPVTWSFDKELTGYPYDPAKAKKLLADAGYPNGFKVEMIAFPNPRGYNPVGGARLAVAVQDYLRRVGVEVSIKQLEWGTFLKTIRSGDYQIGPAGWSADNGDPDNFLFSLYSSTTWGSGNNSRYKNVEVDKLLQDAQETFDREQRIQMYRKAQRTIMDEAPWIFINHTKLIRATSARVQGYVLNPTQMFFHMHQVWVTQ